MGIKIPRRLTYSKLGSLLQALEGEGHERDEICEIDWGQTVWANLPEIAEVLCLSARLIHSGIRVRWLLPDPRSLNFDREKLRFSAHVGSNEHARLEAIRSAAFSRQGLYPRERRTRFDELRKAILGNTKNSRVDAWLKAEHDALEPLDLLGYLDRYKVIERAVDIGVEFASDPRSIPKAAFDYSADSACLEFTPVHSLTEVDALVGRLSTPDELARVLGSYANLDFARGGALSQILVAELGKNVGEHSEASAGWLCTRLVSMENLDLQCQDDPFLQPLLRQKIEFLEVVVCDNGCGIAFGLQNVLKRDQRESVKQKYVETNGRFEESDLVDYAFDRLSSTKRDIADLVHFSDNGRSPVLASGLYWIWNIVRTYRGLVGVRTGSFSGGYDFTKGGISAESMNWQLPHISGLSVSFRFPGTMIRLCLPLTAPQHTGAEIPWTRPVPTVSSEHTSKMQVQLSWVGDIARRTSLRHPRGKPKHELQRLPGFAEIPHFSLLQELQKRHAVLNDGDVILLDLAGTHRLWDSQTVAPLCHFFIEMNYTSTSGRSAVVLWNVPHGDVSLFEIAIDEAAKRYKHVTDFRRAALLVRDDGRTRLYCGWQQAEKILERLVGEGENDLDEIGADELDRDDRERLDRLITENAHLFSWTGQGRVKLRAWPSELRFNAWDQETKWLNGAIDEKVESGGALRQLENGYFQLPTTGRLVERFYSFGGMVSNQKSCSRIAWLLNQVIRGIERLRKKTKYVVSVTRPVMSLARHLVDNYLDGRGIEHIRASTVEELKRFKIAPGNAILITDVVSSGILCSQVREALPDLNWVGTAAILDTGDVDDTDPSYPTVLHDPYDLFITYRVTRNTATGDVFALASRQVKKHDPTEELDKPVTAIDRVNACPVKLPNLNKDLGAPIWPYLSRREEALQVGHFHAGDLHHYIYYINGERLIGAVHPNSELTLCDEIVKTIVNELETTDHDPQKTVIMHPPRDTSYAEEIAIAVQRATGAAYRYVLHREMFAGQRRFSSFIDHGIPIADSTVIVIDDGANTGETLFGLLQAAAASYPNRVTAHIGVSRMPLHKIDFLRRIRSLDGVATKTQIRFAVRLSIPVFSPRSCPICRFRHAVSEIAKHSALLRRYANEILDETVSSTTGSSGDETKQSFRWAFRTVIGAARLREAIELADYHEKSNLHVIETLRRASADHSTASTISDSLIDLAFVICVEPSLLSAPIFIPFIEKVFQQICSQLKHVTCQREFGTLLEFAFHVMVQLMVRRKVKPEDAARMLWHSAIPIDLLDIPALGKFLSACVAEVKNEIGWERVAKVQVCSALATQFGSELKTLDRPDADINGALGRLFVREVIAVLGGKLDVFHAVEENMNSSLFELANSAAGRFWWHASIHVLGHIQALQKDPPEVTRMAGRVHSLLQAFDGLNQFKYRICRVDSIPTGESSGADVFWGAPPLANAIARFAESLTNLAEMVASKKPRYKTPFALAVKGIIQTWEDLYEQLLPAFESIFPVVLEVVDDMWSQCEAIADLPNTTVDPLEKSDELPDNTCCFIPRTLFARFLHVVMQNLRDRAYPTWTATQRNENATVRVVVDRYNEAEGSFVCIKIIDNGPLHRQGKLQSDGQGKGLNDIRRLIKPFGGRVEGPTENNGLTTVALYARIRE